MKKQWMKALSFVLALVMVLSVAPVSFATEAETEPAGSAGITYEPWGHGYRFVDVLNWDPETDPYADELVAEVPLQTRIDTYAPTQVNPELTDRAKLYAISSSNYRSTDVNEAPWNAGMAYDEFGYNLFKFWQYTDMTGAGGRPTADIERGAGDKEYGTIAIPMAAATNAAHKNGVLSIAEYFLPRNPQYTEEWLQKDENGNFPYADKLIEIMEYYGFDGYFINQEEAIPVEYVPVMKEIMKYMMDKGAYIQWYDSLTNSGSISYQNIFNKTNSDFVYDTTHGYGQVSHSIFLNYWYKAGAIKDSAAHAESLGLDPYETVYMGLEGGEWRFGIDLEDFWDIMYNHNRHSGNLMQENGQPYTSFAIWGSDFYREQYNKAENNRYKVPYQWEADERERMYFTSPAENAGDYDTTDIRREDLGFTYEDASSDKTKLSTQTNFKGISRYIVEKSVIGGTVFATDFNTGHGMNYYRNGEVIRDTEWSNLNLQDILPTWQWRVESYDSNLLDLEWDYGTEYTRVQGAFPYTQIGGYNGGNSLAIYGDVGMLQTVGLYKTELEVLDGSSIALTYNKVSGADALEYIILYLQDTANDIEVQYLPLETTVGGWNTVTVDLSEYAGRTIAAINLGVTTSGEKVEGYQINLGRLAVADGTDYTPAAPENVALELALAGTGEYQIGWDLASYDEVKNYHVYAVYADGSYRFVGGAYADEWYVSSLENEDEVVALEVRAVGADGSESEGAQVNLPKNISNIRTVSENNELIVTWQGGEAEVELSYWYSNEEAPDAQTGNGTVTFPIELEDGQKFVLTIDGVPCYFGELADHYAAPYDGEARLQADGKYDLTIPADSDWYSLTTNIGGTYTTYERFGGSKMQDISVPAKGLATMIINITDKDGNVSDPTTKLFFDGIEMDAAGGYESLIPDAQLRAALEAQAGATLADLLAFTGKLDLTGYAVESLAGLNLVTGLSGLDVSGTAITELVDVQLPTSLTEIVVDDCAALALIAMPNRPDTALVLGDLPALTELDIPGYGNFELDLSGAPALVSISLRGSALRHLDISANTALEVLVMDDSAIASIDHAGAYPNAYYWNWTNAKLDLTASTTEGELFETMKTYFATTELPERKSMNVVTLGTGAGWYNNNNSDPSRVIDLGWRHEISSLTFRNAYNTNQYVNRYNVRNATVEVSDDGINWTLAGTYVQEGWTRENMADYTVQTIEIPTGTYGRYVRFTTDDTFHGDAAAGLGNGYPYISAWQVDGHRVAFTGFTYAGQQPAAIRDNIAALNVENDGAEYQTLELLEAHYASARTVSSGTFLRDIEGADWIDAAYVTAQAYAPAGVRVSIVKDGVPYVHPADTLGLVKTEKSAVNLDNVLVHEGYNNEEGWRMFDGLASTKWCGGDGGAMWMAFELANGPAVLSEYKMLHAGSESKDFIAWGYRLQTLNPEKMSEAEYLALDAAGKTAIARDKSYWIDLSVVTGNSDNEPVHEIPMENLVSAQVYRFQVDGSGQPGKQTWGALRIYEMDLFAFEGTLENMTNGMLKADEVGVYEVTYNLAKTPLASTTVTVYEPEVIIASGWSGYTTWKLNDKGVLTFTPSDQSEGGQTNLKNYWKVNGVLTLPWSAYADQILEIVVEDGIHDIGQMAFYELPNLQSVTLGKDIVEIRNYAFKNCKSLTTINLEDVDFIREGAFYGCSALENIDLLDGVVIEDWAFTKTPYASLNP